MTVISNKISAKFEIANYHHAAEIISLSFPEEWSELNECFESFYITTSDISSAGGAETSIPGKIDSVLRPYGWKNVMVSADLRIKLYSRKADSKNYDTEYATEEHSIYDYVKGPHLDFLKSRIGLCVEWNKKDVSYDRVIAAFRTFYELDIISAGVIVTRGEELSSAFNLIKNPDGSSVKSKYGASSTHMKRLLERLDSRQEGGCPILVLGIKSTCVSDLENYK